MKQLITLFFLVLSVAVQAQLTTLQNFLAEPAGMFKYNGNYLFAQRGTGTGVELWKTDGTAAGTVMIKDIAPGTASSFPTQFYLLNNKVVFFAQVDNTQKGLFVTDGTTTGTLPLFTNTWSVESEEMAEFQGNLYGLFIDAAYGSLNLVKTDGTSAEVISNITGVVGASSYSKGEQFKILNVVNNKLLFVVNTTSACKIYTSNGTAAGTQVVATIPAEPGTMFDVEKIRVATMGTGLYFTLSVNNHSKQYLYRLDATNYQPSLLFTDTDGDATSWHYLGIRFIMNNELYFAATINGVQELYKTDGSVAGTVLVKSFGFGNSTAFFNVTYRDNLGTISVQGSHTYFVTNGNGVQTLWNTDGTTAGTVAIPITGITSQSLLIEDLFALEGQFYIGTKDNTSGQGKLFLFNEAAGTVEAAGTQTGGNTFQYASSLTTNVCNRSVHSFNWRYSRYQYRFLPGSLMPELNRYGISFSRYAANDFRGLHSTSLFSDYQAVSTLYPQGTGYLFFGAKPSGYDLGFVETAALTCSALPVQFTNVNASWLGQKAVISWSTATEAGLSFYEVQKESTNGQWITLKNRTPGNQVYNTYQEFDESVAGGLNLYRVASRYHDGTVTYSKVVSLNKEHINRLQVQSTGGLHSLIITGSANEVFTVRVLSADGKMISQLNIPVNVRVNIAGRLAAGVYSVKAVSNTNRTVLFTRFIK